MTEIVKLTVDGEDHWTAKGSQAHEDLLARQQEAEQQTSAAGQEDAGLTEEEGAGAEQQEPQVHRDGDDHDAAGADGGSRVGAGDDSGATRSKRRGGASQPASGS